MKEAEFNKAIDEVGNIYESLKDRYIQDSSPTDFQNNSKEYFDKLQKLRNIACRQLQINHQESNK